MPREVVWKLRLRTDNPAEIPQSILAFLSNAAGATRSGDSTASKDHPERWEIVLTTEFASPPAEGVLRLLGDAHYLASGWIVYGPVMCDNGELIEFFGMFKEFQNSRARVAGLEFATFTVAQLPPSHGA